jgi:hypothetical protein
MAGFVASGFGLWGIRVFRRRWKRLAVLAAAASALVILVFWMNAYGAFGLAVDLAAVAMVRLAAVPEGLEVGNGGKPTRIARFGARLARPAGVAFVAWLGLLSLTAPWYRFWGSSAAELDEALPGDVALQSPPTYWLQHAVTIDAPAEAVWPWLAQLGTDRGGFYSYSLLERAFGIDVRNADRIHEEWQDIRTGGFILATPAGYLGIDRPLGWNLSLVIPGRAMVLENWGAFVLVPAGDSATRLIVRTRNGQPTGLAGLTLAWAGLVMFEPAHFLMERRMLLGVKQRAEAAGIR